MTEPLPGPHNAAELALFLRAIYEGLVAGIDDRIFDGLPPINVSPEFLAGALMVVETAETLSGLEPLPPDFFDA